MNANQDIWLQIFQTHIGNVNKYLQTSSTPSFSIYRTAFDAM